MNYKLIDWDDVKNYGSKVLAIEIDNPGMVVDLELNDSKREELLVVDRFVLHNDNKYGPNGNVKIYEIVDRAVDNKGNLLLFVKPNFIEYERR